MQSDRLSTLRVTTPSEDRVIETTPADRGLPMTQVLRHHGIPLNTRCGDRGLCEGCTVRVTAGAVEHINGRGPDSRQDGAVKACQCRLPGGRDLALDIPERSLARFDAHTVDDFTTTLPHAHDPLIDPDAHGDAPVGVAVDIGTTTLALLLVDLTDGRILARGGAFNRQIDYADNVLTRINLCGTDPGARKALQYAVVNQTLAKVLRQALDQAGVAVDRLACFVAAGNATMLHLFTGEDPTSMGVAPFTAAFLDHRCTTTDQIGLRLGDVPGPRPVQVHLLPSAAAYVGADIVAGVVASGLGYDAGTTLLIDVGTNGEMVLSHGGDLIGCATAAGPAFEGGTLADGVRAGDGAISRLRVKTDPLSFEVQTIGSGKPIGVCGSAYIDFLAESRRAGVLNAAGRLVPDLESDLVIRDDYGRSVRVAYGQGKRPIMIREADVAALMQAKAAIAAGALTLLERYQLRPADIDRVCLAGGFGRYVDVANAIDCGLLPGFTAGQVQAMGNLSLAGAYMALLDRAMLDEHKRTARAISVIELNQEPGFEDCYIEQLML